MSEDSFTTVSAPVRVEIDKIKGSRFICDLAPASRTQTAHEVVARVRAEEPGASHHCWAYRLSSGRSRSSDDGEPGGTAGPPILRRLEAAGLADVIAVVSRYYGGTNLGTGGLIRAYGAATAAAIEAGSLVIHRRTEEFRIEHPYELSNAVEQTLAAFEGEAVESTFGASVTLRVRVPSERAATFPDELRERTSGTVHARPIEP